jgi:hypothetical protein
MIEMRQNHNSYEAARAAIAYPSDTAAYRLRFTGTLGPKSEFLSEKRELRRSPPAVTTPLFRLDHSHPTSVGSGQDGRSSYGGL